MLPVQDMRNPSEAVCQVEEWESNLPIQGKWIYEENNEDEENNEGRGKASGSLI